MWIAAILISQIHMAIILTIVRRLTAITRPPLAIFGCELMLVPSILALVEHNGMPHPGIIMVCIASLIAGYMLLGRSIQGGGAVRPN